MAPGPANGRGSEITAIENRAMSTNPSFNSVKAQKSYVFLLGRRGPTTRRADRAGDFGLVCVWEWVVRWCRSLAWQHKKVNSAVYWEGGSGPLALASADNEIATPTFPSSARFSICLE